MAVIDNPRRTRGSVRDAGTSSNLDHVGSDGDVGDLYYVVEHTLRVLRPITVVVESLCTESRRFRGRLPQVRHRCQVSPRATAAALECPRQASGTPSSNLRAVKPRTVSGIDPRVHPGSGRVEESPGLPLGSRARLKSRGFGRSPAYGGTRSGNVLLWRAACIRQFFSPQPDTSDEDRTHVPTSHGRRFRDGQPDLFGHCIARRLRRGRARKFDWAAPDEEVHAFVNNIAALGHPPVRAADVRDDGLVGDRRSCGGVPGLRGDLAGGQRLYSRTLHTVFSERTRIDREFDAAAIRRLKQSRSDISIGGAELAGLAVAQGLVDECHLFLGPVLVGGGKHALPAGVPRRARAVGRAPLSQRRCLSPLRFMSRRSSMKALDCRTVSGITEPCAAPGFASRRSTYHEPWPEHPGPRFDTLVAVMNPGRGPDSYDDSLLALFAAIASRDHVGVDANAWLATGPSATRVLGRRVRP